MWLFTKYGFFSAVSKDGGETIEVRARRREDLEQLGVNTPIPAGTPIVETPYADYRYRVVLTPAQWAWVCESLAREVCYPNFKDECAAQRGKQSDYVEMLHDVWELMRRYQQKGMRSDG